MSDVKLISTLNYIGRLFFLSTNIKYLDSLMDLDDVNEGSKVCSFIKLNT